MQVGSAWGDAVVGLGGARPAAEGSAAELVRRYGERHRRYHTLSHVAAVLRDSGVLADSLGLGERARHSVVLAACAHDVVYDARPGADERASAAWARDALLGAGTGPVTARRVEQLVLMTLSHRCDPSDLAGAALLDADLAILAAAPDAYAAYVSAVRSEYAAVDDEQWRTGRTGVLRDLLARERLYLSAPGRDRWEAAARRNIDAELAQLAGTA